MLHGRFVRETLMALGFIVQEAECVGLTEPLTSNEALGYIIDLKSQQFISSPMRIDRVLSLAHEILHKSDKVPVKKLAALKGLILSCWLFIGSPVRTFTRYMDIAIQSRLKPQEAKLPSKRLRHTWLRSVHLSLLCIQEIHCWIRNLIERNGRPISALHASGSVDVWVSVDASDSGWGGAITISPDGVVDDASTNRFISNLCHSAAAGTSRNLVISRAGHGLVLYAAFDEQTRKAPLCVK